MQIQYGKYIISIVPYRTCAHQTSSMPSLGLQLYAAVHLLNISQSHLLYRVLPGSSYYVVTK